MSRILTFDPSTICGWAHGSEPGKAISGILKLPAGGTVSQKAIEAENFTVNMIRANGITKVYCETPILPKVTSFQSVATIVSVALAVGMAARKCGADTIMVDQQTWRSQFMGATQAPKMNDDAVMAIMVDLRDKAAVDRYKRTLTEKTQKSRRSEARRRWLKQRCITQCEVLGYKPADDNQADAIGIFEAVMKMTMSKHNAPTFDFVDQMQV